MWRVKTGIATKLLIILWEDIYIYIYIYTVILCMTFNGIFTNMEPLKMASEQCQNIHYVNLLILNFNKYRIGLN
jgi:hypothetical protein